MKKALIVGGIILVLVLIVSGLKGENAPQGTDASQSKNDSQLSGEDLFTTSSDQIPQDGKGSLGEDVDELMLGAEYLGNGSVELWWLVPAEMEGSEFRIVRGPNENPVYPGNYYYHQGSDRRTIVWGNLAPRKEHFRICQFIDGSCVSYSNDIAITID